MTPRRVVAILAAVLVASSMITPAVALTGSSDVFSPAVVEQNTFYGAWSPGEEIVRYGDGDPGWVVEYENGSLADVEAWADASSSRKIRSYHNGTDMVVVSAPASHVGATWSLSDQLRDAAYVEQIGITHRVEIDPITGTELRTESEWIRPAGSRLATRFGTRGELDPSGAAWKDEVNTSSLEDVRKRLDVPNTSATGAGMRVAVLDTGLNYDDDRYGSRVVTGKNVITGEVIDSTKTAENRSYDKVADGSSSRHGTHVTTTIAGNGSGANATGIAPDADIIPVKVLADDGTGSTADIAAGLEYACGDANADVVSMSLGSPLSSIQLEAEIEECLTNTSTSAVVVAAGNNRMTYRYVASPADAEQDVIAVAATDTRPLNESETAYFSAVGPDPVTGEGVDVGAPGLKVAAEVDTGNRTLSGTSMATPVVSGVLLLTLETHPDLVNESRELKTYLEEHAEAMPNAGETEVGHGRVNAETAADDLVVEETQAEALDDEAAARDTGNEALSGSTFRRLPRLAIPGLSIALARLAGA